MMVTNDDGIIYDLTNDGIIDLHGIKPQVGRPRWECGRELLQLLPNWL